MGQRDYVSISERCIPKVGEEGKDFGGDPADWGELVPQESNQVEDLESIPLKIVELKHGIRQVLSKTRLRQLVL